MLKLYSYQLVQVPKLVTCTRNAPKTTNQP